MMLSSMSVMLRDVADLAALPLQVAAQHVEHEAEAAVAEVRQAVHGGPADVHRHLARLSGLERDHPAQCGVVESEHPGTVTRTCRPRSRRSRPSTASSRNGAHDGRPTAPTASTAPRPATRSTRSTRRRRRCRARCTSGTCASYTHNDLVARFQRMRGQRGLLPDGVGRQRPQRRAAGADHARRALRPVAPLRPRLRGRADRPRSDRFPCRGPTSWSCAPTSPSSSRRSTSSLWSTLGLSVDWAHDVHDDRDKARRVSQHGFLATPRTRPSPTGPRDPRCGTST